MMGMVVALTGSFIEMKGRGNDHSPSSSQSFISISSANSAAS